MNKSVLVFTMHKVGSSTLMNTLRSVRINPDRGYRENVDYFLNFDYFDKIITAIRDPVARNISYFFEHWEQHLDGVEPQDYQGDLVEAFHAEVEHDYPLNFFDEVFRPCFEIDVFRHEFQPEKGYTIINNVLVLRTDMMNTVLASALVELLDLPKGTYISVEHRANTVTTRPYGDVYTKFVDTVRFDNEYLDKMYRSKYVEHFFSKEEIKKMRAKWSKK